MKTRIVVIGVVLLGWTACARATITYDVANDFSATTNPNTDKNGAWSYGYYLPPDGNPSSFTLFTTHQQVPDFDSGGPTNIDGWTKPGDWSAPNVTHNGTATTVSRYGITWAPNAVGLTSYNNSGGIAAVRWTAPVAGTIDVAAAFTPIASSDLSNYYVIRNDTDFRLNQQQTGSPVPWTVSNLSVAFGDHLDFVVAGMTLTQLGATITYVPEPSAITLLATGLFGLLAYAWRKRR
jgi:hypothetical protein